MVSYCCYTSILENKALLPNILEFKLYATQPTSKIEQTELKLNTKVGTLAFTAPEVFTDPFYK